MAKTELEAISKMITAIENCKKDMAAVAQLITSSVDEIKAVNDNSDATKRLEKQVYNSTGNLLRAVLKLDNLKEDMIKDYKKFLDYEEG